MAARIKQINQKHGMLKAKTSFLEKVISEAETDPPRREDLKLVHTRLARTKKLFNAYEILHDELADNVPADDPALLEFETIEDRYERATIKIEELFPIDSPQPGFDTTAVSGDKTRKLKLPIAELPKFSSDLSKGL